MRAKKRREKVALISRLKIVTLAYCARNVLQTADVNIGAERMRCRAASGERIDRKGPRRSDSPLRYTAVKIALDRTYVPVHRH